MHVNPWLYPMLVLAITAFFAGDRLIVRAQARMARAAFLATATLLSLPGLLFTLYYTHRFDHAQWFYEFRALPYTELSAAGMLSALLTGPQYGTRAARLLSASVLFLWLLVPYAKNLLYPAVPALFRDVWQMNVCMQSIGSSCGPAAAATLLREAGIPATEAELARDSYTSMSGTEIWYLARALRKRGCTTRYHFTPPDPARLSTPALAGTRLGGADGSGHFIALLASTPYGYRAGDSLVGPVELPAGDYRPYHFTGCFLLVETR